MKWIVMSFMIMLGASATPAGAGISDVCLDHQGNVYYVQENILQGYDIYKNTERLETLTDVRILFTGISRADIFYYVLYNAMTGRYEVHIGDHSYELPFEEEINVLKIVVDEKGRSYVAVQEQAQANIFIVNNGRIKLRQFNAQFLEIGYTEKGEALSSIRDLTTGRMKIYKDGDELNSFFITD